MLLIYVRFLWVASLLGFIITLGLVNVYLPSHVVFTMENVLEFGYAIPRNTFTYSVLAFAMFINGGMLAFGNLFRYLPKKYIIVPAKQKWLATIYNHKRLATTFKHWTKGIITCFNLFIILFVISVYSMYHNVQASTSWGFVFVGILLLGWLIYYPIVFTTTVHEED
jgi:hypothetical protein